MKITANKSVGLSYVNPLVRQPRPRNGILRPTYIAAILLAIVVSWTARWMDLNDRLIIPGADEIALNHVLRRGLNDTRISGSVRSFGTREFDRPQVDAASPTHDGSEYKEPDITISIAGKCPAYVKDPLNYSAFIECKILNDKSNVSHYLGDGVMRFVDGSYAQSMSDGFMVGYARTKQTLEFLREVLSKNEKWRFDLNIVGEPQLTVRDDGSMVLTSVHERKWRYPDGSSPGNIQIHHVWLIAKA